MTTSTNGQHRIPVWVKALDPLSQFGLVHALRQRPEINLINDTDLTAPMPGQPAQSAQLAQQGDQRPAPPVVALIAVDSLDAGAVQVLRAATQRGCRRTVLIGSTIDDDALMTAVELGVSGVLRRTEATADRIVHLVQAAAAGDGSLPPDLLGRLLGQVSRMQRHVPAPRGCPTPVCPTARRRYCGWWPTARTRRRSPVSCPTRSGRSRTSCTR